MMRKINITSALLMLQFAAVSFLLSCNYQNKIIKFDKNKWNEQTDPLFPSRYRANMLADLITNYNLVGLNYTQLIEFLGIPDTKDSGSLTYKIVVDYNRGIDPIYTKDLDFYFSKDSVITSFKVNEWKKQ